MPLALDQMPDGEQYAAVEPEPLARFGPPVRVEELEIDAVAKHHDLVGGDAEIDNGVLNSLTYRDNSRCGLCSRDDHPARPGVAGDVIHIRASGRDDNGLVQPLAQFNGRDPVGIKVMRVDQMKVVLL